MTNRLALLSAAAAASALLLGAASAPVDALRIRWSELRPADQEAGMVVMPSTRRVDAGQGRDAISHLEGKQIELTGYLLPVDREGDLVYEFLLLPMSGLCSHMPPPPPNQAVHVFPAKPYKSTEIYEAGDGIGDAAARVGKDAADHPRRRLGHRDPATVSAKAEIAKADSVPDALPSRKATPWSFLNKKANSE